MTKSEQLFERAKKRIPGGVNSPVRAYGSIGEAPVLSKVQTDAGLRTWTGITILITSVPGGR